MKSKYIVKFEKGASVVEGTCFTITWPRLKQHLETLNVKRMGRVVSMCADSRGITIFSKGGDITAWSPKI